MKSVIMLEFNELTPRLMDQFMAEGILPNFERLKRSSIVATTDAGEDPPALNPWIQWVSIHTGKSYAEHGVFHLSDGPSYKGKRIWDIVSDSGKPVWVCGSMNPAIEGEAINGAILPDPWCSGVTPYPPAMADYFKLVSKFVQEHSSEKLPVEFSDILRFGRFMVANGLSIATMRATLKQLLEERSKRTHWARALILDRLQRDVFKFQYKKLKPALATLFVNSTAHFQHFYWRNFEPQHFSLKPTNEDQQRFGDAVRQGYIRMDETVGEVLDMAGPETSIIFATALSQQPLVKFDVDGGKQLFRPLDGDRLCAFVGVTDSYRFEPVMSEKFNLVFETEEAAQASQAKFDACQIEGSRLMVTRVDGCKLVLNCAINAFLPEGAMVQIQKSNSTAVFTDLFYPIEGVKSGMHHRDGMLWIRTPSASHEVIERKISLLELAPTALYLSGTGIPDKMQPPLAEVVTQVKYRLAEAA